MYWYITLYWFTDLTPVLCCEQYTLIIIVQNLFDYWPTDYRDADYRRRFQTLERVKRL